MADVLSIMRLGASAAMSKACGVYVAAHTDHEEARLRLWAPSALQALLFVLDKVSAADSGPTACAALALSGIVSHNLWAATPSQLMSLTAPPPELLGSQPGLPPWPLPCFLPASLAHRTPPSECGGRLCACWAALLPSLALKRWALSWGWQCWSELLSLESAMLPCCGLLAAGPKGQAAVPPSSCSGGLHLS